MPPRDLTRFLHGIPLRTSCNPLSAQVTPGAPRHPTFRRPLPSGPRPPAPSAGTPTRPTRGPQGAAARREWSAAVSEGGCGGGARSPLPAWFAVLRPSRARTGSQRREPARPSAEQRAGTGVRSERVGAGGPHGLGASAGLRWALSSALTDEGRGRGWKGRHKTPRPSHDWSPGRRYRRRRDLDDAPTGRSNTRAGLRRRR